MAGIRVCLPGKRTAVVSVTPFKVKYPVGHADHSKGARPPGKYTAAVLITPLKVQNRVGRNGEQCSNPTR